MVEQGQVSSILIVEDDEGVAEDLAAALDAAGYRPICAKGAQDANIKLSNQRFSLALIDLKLAQGKGEDIILGTRARDSLNKDTPIVLISGYLDPELIKRVGPLVNGMLVKPFDMKTVIARVAAVLAAPGTRVKDGA
jgi:two-component system phosphate regulon response regulator OmpR